jgi:hypothetical protein
LAGCCAARAPRSRLVTSSAKLASTDCEFAVHYARAMELRCEKMAEEILEISDDNYTGPDGRGDNALVQQARLRVDSRAGCFRS